MIARALGPLALFSLLAAPAVAQQGAREEPRIALRGVVVDALHGDPLPNAMIRLMKQRKGVLTDSLGRFVMADVRLGPDVLAVKQYGYEDIDIQLTLAEGQTPLRIELQPGPLALEGFTVIADRLALMNQRLKNRRNATPVSVRALDQTRLNRSGARDMADFLWLDAGLMPAACPSRSMGMGSCILRRGQPYRPKVFIDESPTIGGIDELGMYDPSDFYLVEVYSSGWEIHAYTHWFMERMARRPMALIPIILP